MTTPFSGTVGHP